jgi:F-type H+-transporting ATPase subunit delta
VALRAVALRIARRYAQALFEALKSDQALERAERDLEAFGRVTSSLPSLESVLAHPGVSAERKKALLDAAFGGLDFLPETRRMIGMLAEAGALGALPAIAVAFRALKDRKLRMVAVEVTTAAAIPDDERATWESALAKTAGSRVRIDFKTDPSLIGGAVARVGSVMYDGSVRGSLERIRQSLLGE